MKKSIFQASFEESLNLYDIAFVRENFESAQEKEKYRGSLQSYIWLVVLSTLFLIIPNWLLMVGANYLFSHSNSKYFAFSISSINFLPPWVFWLSLIIWLLLIVIGKGIRQSYLLIYRGQFHMLVTFVIWLLVEVNLFFMTLFYRLLTFWGMAFFMIVTGYLSFVINTGVNALHFQLYQIEKSQFRSSMLTKLLSTILRYLAVPVIIWVIIAFIFPDIKSLRLDYLRAIGILILWSIGNVIILAWESFTMFPFILQGYYKWKYPENYREWEGKTREEWYGKKYLDKQLNIKGVRNYEKEKDSQKY